METWPERAPPKSDPMVLVISPKLALLMLVSGSPRLVWLRTLVKVPSARRRTRSVMGKVLLRPVERLIVPGPTTEPTCALPKRPIGLGTGLSGWPVVGSKPAPVVQGVPGVHLE